MIEAERIKNLPPYLFAEIDRKIADKRALGIDIISLGIGDPDIPTPKNIIDIMKKEVENPENHRYPSYYGLPAFRDAVAEWYSKKYDVSLNSSDEILPLIGSKEGIAHIYWAFVDPGDIVLVPDPAYPVYATGVILAGGSPYAVPLLEENGFLPDFENIPKDVADKAKIIIINYPNNPTAAIVNEEFFDTAIEFCTKHNIVLCHDFAYAEIAFNGYKPPSLLQREGAIDIGVEFYSLSKTYNMTGWRIGSLAGNKNIIDALGRVKTNIDSGIFNATQKAGIEALTGPQNIVKEMCDTYKERRDFAVSKLRSYGFSFAEPKASIYIWIKVPDGYSSTSFATKVLEEAAVVISPGNAYGKYGEGYFRISLTINTDRLNEALNRIGDIL